MLNIAFQYDYARNDWEQCENPMLINEDIEKLPYVLIVAYQKEDGKNTPHYVFCPLHQNMEKITSVEHNLVTTVEGCFFDGLIAIGTFPYEYYSYRMKTIYVPFRWRIFQRNESEAINIACDVAEIQRGRSGIHKNRHWQTFAISANMATRKHRVIDLKETYCSESHCWMTTEKTLDIEIPDIVVDTALNALRESVRHISGIKPSVLSQMKGIAKLTAFIERPYDLHIIYLKNFLRMIVDKDFDPLFPKDWRNNYFGRMIAKDKFEQAFPYEQKDNYRAICGLLGINPPKSLRKAYACNPFAIVWYMMFRQWGITDINLMRPFFSLNYCIANLYLHKFYFDIKASRVERLWNEAQTEWHALEHYALWHVQQKKERRFLHWLYRTSTENSMTRLQWDILIPFQQHFRQLSNDVKTLLLRDGLTPYVHNAINWEVSKLSNHNKNIRLLYKKNILSYECKINGYEFHLAHDTDSLYLFGKNLKNCVASYIGQVAGYISIIVAVKHNGLYEACIEIQKENHIVQALGVYNERLHGEILLACRYWAKMKKLTVDVDDLDLPMENNLQDWATATVETIAYRKAIDEMNLEELLTLPKNEVGRHYYLSLVDELLKECQQMVCAPPWMQFADEKSYLKYVFPQGERIYEEAFAGNGEAQRALGLMYYMGKTFPQDLNKAYNWLMAAVKAGEKKAAWEAARLKMAAESGDIEINYKILQALRRIRNTMTRTADNNTREAG